MKRIVFAGSVGLAFAAGYTVSNWSPPAEAQATAMTAQIVHVPDQTGDALGPAAPLTQ
jgi:hypothetical protein